MAKQVSGKETKASFNEIWRSSRAPGRGWEAWWWEKREEKRKVGRRSEQRGCCHPADVTLTSDTNDPPDRLTPPIHPPHLAFSPVLAFSHPPLSLSLSRSLPFSDTGFDVDDATSVLRFCWLSLGLNLLIKKQCCKIVVRRLELTFTAI